MTSLTSRRALITGSTGGLGLAIAHGLADAGCAVILTGPMSPADADPVRAGLAAVDATVRYIQADLSNEAGVTELAESVIRDGGVDILVNNAVVRHFASIETFQPGHWNEALAVNLSAPFHAIRLLLPGMRARGWGRIVNMASVYGSRGTTGRVDYITTKAALLGLTRAVAAETAGSGITCNAVCPGSVSTPGTESRVDEIMREQGVSREAAVRQFLHGKQPSGQFVAVESVVAAVLFLCGPAGTDINGAQIPVDAGWLAQ
jgi:3-hydroxybutyrate dehydrogenase